MTAIKRDKANEFFDSIPNASNGQIFVGAGLGWSRYDPEYECGGSGNTHRRQCPHVSADTVAKSYIGSNRKIHIDIASYRDSLCAETLLGIFFGAVQPQSIQIRILLQDDSAGGDRDCVTDYCELASKIRGIERANVEGHTGDCPHVTQIEVHRIHAEDAAGPMHARSLLSEDISNAYQNGRLDSNDYCLSIDSHMAFDSDWDMQIVDMWDKVKNEYAILSTRPADVEYLGENVNGVYDVPHSCEVKFTPHARTGESKVARNLSKPKLTNALWSAGFSFSKCHAELKVPVDRHAPNVFSGEEINRAARFWTYGYDIYTPNRIIIAHDYERSRKNPAAFSWRRDDANWTSTLAASHVHLKTLLGMPLPGEEIVKDEVNLARLRRSKFGLGDRRSLEQLVQFSGIDFSHEKYPLDGISRCGNLRWVPFKEHPKGAEYIPLFDEKTEDPVDIPDETSVWFEHGLEHQQDDGPRGTGSKLGGGVDPPNGGTPEGYLRNPDAGPKQSHHGLRELPFLVQLIVSVLVLGVFLSIILQRNTGAGRKKLLARSKRLV